MITTSYPSLVLPIPLFLLFLFSHSTYHHIQQYILHLFIVLIFVCVLSLECKLPKGKDLLRVFFPPVCCCVLKSQNSVWHIAHAQRIFVELGINFCSPRAQVKALHRVGVQQMFIDLRSAEVRIDLLYLSSSECGLESNGSDSVTSTCVTQLH